MSLTKATYSMVSGAPINVLDYGVSTTNSAAVNGAAFAAAMAAGNEIYIPAGTYAVTTLAVPNKRMVIRGAGVDTTILQTTSTNGIDFDHFSSTYLSRFSVLEEMTIQAAAGTNGIMINNGGIKARNIYAYGGIRGIYLANSVLGDYQDIVAAGSSSAILVASAPVPAIGEVVQLNTFINVSCAPNNGLEYPFGLLVSGNVQFFRNTFIALDCEHCSTGVQLLNGVGVTVSSNVFINYWSEGSNVAHLFEGTDVFNTWINPWFTPADAIPFTIRNASWYQDAGVVQSATKFKAFSEGTTNATFGLDIQDLNEEVLFTVRSDGLLTTATTGALGPFNNTTASVANMVVNSSGQILRSTSSLKYKKDVQDAVHGLDKVMQLRSVTYKGNTDGDTIFGGLIAEEVHAAGLNEFVQYAEDGSPDSLAYGNMVSLTFKAIQELKAEFDAYKTSHP